MDNKVSFIPKKTMGAPVYKSRGLGIVISFALIVFLGSASLWAALFFYEKYLNEQINEKRASLERVRAEIEPSFITDLVQLSGKIDAAKSLIKNHKTPSSIFVFLQDNTLKDVRFKDFDFLISNDGEPSISMSGLAKNYASLALQADAFEKSSIVRNTVFSGFKLDVSGRVNFDVEIIFDPSVLAYNLE